LFALTYTFLSITLFLLLEKWHSSVEYVPFIHKIAKDISRK
jgi:hypothetical protein